ncbi:MAG: right-handed parallel beta-helix repeat-containing protein [Rikenellaceae bacterium]
MRLNLKLAFLCLVCSVSSLQARTLYVSKSGSDQNEGSKEAPYLTISKAAYHAIAGDTVLVSEGTYREWVSPLNSGINATRRIVYMTVPGDDVYIKGSEVVDTWKKGKNGLWTAELDNIMFGDFNPYATTIYGDWLKNGWELHLGEVYIDGEALFENKERLDTVGFWSATVNTATTVIEANFGDKNPNKSLTEINVRPACFFPKKSGVNYITVDGFKVSQAATQWAAPTNEQEGAIGPNWSKGWVIENCEVSYSKCVGICIGKEKASGHNMYSLYNKEPGYNMEGFNREIEAIFKAYDLGWSKENIGSHLIQNNVIHNCGQSGIVGHLGCSFSIVRGNEIYDINRTDEKISGWETAGIKLHAAIDTYIENNIIVNTTRGLWLDWQAQGTHVCGNVIDESDMNDIFVEVSHGPTMVYNNIFLSDLGIRVDAQGIVFANNLVWGRVHVLESRDRYTPYHYPHSTKIKGLFNNTGGDNRFYNNIFLGQSADFKVGKNGLESLENYPTVQEVEDSKPIPFFKKLSMRFPMTCEGNVFFHEAKPSEKFESGAVTYPDTEVKAKLMKKDGAYYLDGYHIDEALLKKVKTVGVNTDMLGTTIIAQMLFLHADGTDFILDKDKYGEPRDANAPMVGPSEDVNTKLPIWPVKK